MRAAGQTPRADRILVLVELAGGNDGLNTVVPITDPAYRALRPDIGLSRDRALTLDADTALHPDLRPVAEMWEGGELRIIEGVGYPDPNRSHFRSIEIWNAGQGADSLSQRGWVSQALPASGGDADGVVLGGEMGPLKGTGRFTALRDEELFLDTLDALPGPHAVRPAAAQSPLSHVLATYESAAITGNAIRRRLDRSRPRRWHFRTRIWASNCAPPHGC